MPTTGGLGSFGARPNPVPVTQGQPATFDAFWSGLLPGRYLGRLAYVYVDVP